jgi:hypothetical protein
VSQIKATAGVHWLTGSTGATVETVQSVLGKLSRPEGPGGFGHPFKRFHESGTAVYCGSSAPDQPIVINAPGEVCETWADEIARAFVQLDARCTRIDVAMDVEPADLARRRLVHMSRAWKLGRVETRIRRTSWSMHKSDGEGEGWTLYLGRPQSELMLRIYDRRGPLRIETQWRPQGVARGLVPELLVRKGAAHMWRRCASRVRLKLDWYQQLLAGDVEELPPDMRVQSALGDAVFHIWKQQGISLWALHSMGYEVPDLMRVPDELTGPQERKLRRWADDAERDGRDVTAFRVELERRCRK